MSAKGGSKDDLRRVIIGLQKKVLLLTCESANQREYIAAEIYKSWCNYTHCQPYKWSDVTALTKAEYRERADDAVKLFLSNIQMTDGEKLTQASDRDGSSPFGPAMCSAADVARVIADKFGCTIDQAENKITRTMDILRLDRGNAESFLLAVRVDRLKPPNADFRRGEPDATTQPAGESPSPARNG